LNPGSQAATPVTPPFPALRRSAPRSPSPPRQRRL
jgi:hypothetical protein